MKITAQQLTALITAFSAHAMLISERATAGDDESAIRAAIAAAEHKSATDRIAALEADIAKQAGTAAADLKKEQDAHAKTAKDLAELRAKYDAIAGFAAGTARDPGGDTSQQSATDLRGLTGATQDAAIRTAWESDARARAYFHGAFDVFSHAVRTDGLAKVQSEINRAPA